MGRGLDQKDTGARRRSHRDFRTSQFGALRQARRFDVGLFPLHSPLLRESRLVSFPPLNNMLKFSGCSRLNSGRTVEGGEDTPLPRASLSGPYAGSPPRTPTPPPRVESRTRTNSRRTAAAAAAARPTPASSPSRDGSKSRRRLTFARATDLQRDPEADVVPGLTRDRHSRSEGRRSMCSAIHITSRT